MNQTIKLDTRKREGKYGEARIAPLRRGERNNVTLTVAVRRDRRPYDLADMTAHLVWKAADGKLVGPVPMEVTDQAAGTVRCTLPDACYSAVGTARAYVELRRGAELVDTTDEMLIEVLECIDADAEQAEEYKPLIAEAREAVADAKRAADGADAAASHQPRIGGAGTWETWDAAAGAYADTGVSAQGSKGEPGSDANVTKENVEAALGYEPLKGLSIAGTYVQPVGCVVDVPIASLDKYGTVKSGSAADGVYVDSSGVIRIQIAGTSQIDSRSTRYQPISPQFLDYAVKAAMCDGKGAAWTADEQKAARERMNAADANKVYIMQKQIENLQGIAATEETDSTEAYTKTVPTGAQKWASLDKVGGKTVVWNQLVTRIANNITTPKGVTITNEGGTTFSLNGTASGDWWPQYNLYNESPSFIIGHKYLLISNTNKAPETHIYIDSSECGAYLYDGNIITASVAGNMSVQSKLESGFTYDPSVKYTIQIHDLTAMFGEGNEPATVDEFRAMFPADYYPYNPGELMSAEVVEVESKGTFIIPDKVRDMCPGYGWSAGTVCNEIDFERKVYVQRVATVDLGTLAYWNGSTAVSGKYRFGSDSVKDIKPITQNVFTKDLRYNGSTYNYVDGIDISTQGVIYICDSRYETAVDFKSAMQGVLLYYELAEPIEIDLSDMLRDDHYIEVEVGGTVTFKQASTQLPIPSSVTYQISTKEVVANA